MEFNWKKLVFDCFYDSIKSVKTFQECLCFDIVEFCQAWNVYLMSIILEFIWINCKINFKDGSAF